MRRLLLTLAMVVAVVALPGCRPLTVVTVDAGSDAGPAATGLAGVTWNAGDLSLLAPFAPPSVRFGAKLDDVSPAEGVLDLDRVLAKVDAIVAVGGRPVVTLSQMPTWLARTPPSGCVEDRRATPCSRSAMGPTDLGKWETLVHDVVAALAADGARDFEVWNEPNNTRSWADTDEMFLVTAAATHRAVARTSAEMGVPLALGGPATGDTSRLIAKYVDTVTAQGTPPAFVSWHHYTRSPGDYPADSATVRTMAPDRDLVVSEWNYYGRRNDSRVTEQGAAFALAALTEMEGAGVARANLYRGIAVGDRSDTSGLVDGIGARRPAWWVFDAWARLQGTRNRVTGAAAPVWARSVRTGSRVDVLVAVYDESGGTGDRDVDLRVDHCSPVGDTVVRTIDASSKDWAHPTGRPASPVTTLTLAAPAAAWVTLSCSMEVQS